LSRSTNQCYFAAAVPPKPVLNRAGRYPLQHITSSTRSTILSVSRIVTDGVVMHSSTLYHGALPSSLQFRFVCAKRRLPRWFTATQTVASSQTMRGVSITFHPANAPKHCHLNTSALSVLSRCRRLQSYAYLPRSSYRPAARAVNALERAACRVPYTACRIPRAGSACRIPRAGYRVPGTACRVPRAGYRVPGTACRVPRAAYRRVPDTACRVPRAGFRLPHSACRRMRNISPFNTHCPPLVVVAAVINTHSWTVLIQHCAH
jgi:hypothetical protein